MKQNKRALLLAVIVLFGFFSFFFQESRIPFAETSDARYSEIAYETYRFGNWLIPRQNRMAHITKPPLVYWFVAAGYAVFGVNEFGGRFFSGLFGLLCALLVFFLARFFVDRDIEAFLAAIIFETSPLIIGAGRIVTTDIFLLFFTLLAMYGFLMAYREQKKSGVWLFWVSLGFSGMAKGPIGLILAGGVIGIFLWIEHEGKFIKTLLKPLPVLVFLLLAFWWPVFIMLKLPGAFNYLVVEQMLSRFSRHGFGHPQPVAFYLYLFPAATFPWIIPAVEGVFQSVRSKRSFETVLLISWLLFPLIFFTVPSSKLILYVLFSVPPAAILGARFVYHTSYRGTLLTYIAAESLLVAATLLFWMHGLGPLENRFALFIATAILSFNLLLLFVRKYPVATVLTTAVKVLVVMAFALHLLGLQPLKYIKTAKPLAKAVNALENPSHGGIAVVCDGFIARSLTLYTGINPLETKIDNETLPEEVKKSPTILSEKNLWQMFRARVPMLFIREKQDHRPLPGKLAKIWEGKDYMMFSNLPLLQAAKPELNTEN
ncbi:MAG: glycosyltransferase family 39 protein [Acidobacteria bacterium]|nr:glycosyltransferase family 39 protein [Acidobacteriota bacterium]